MTDVKKDTVTDEGHDREGERKRSRKSKVSEKTELQKRKTSEKSEIRKKKGRKTVRYSFVENKENRNHKDSVFVDLFYSDADAGKNLLSLYNAVFDMSLTEQSDLKKVRLENVLFKPFANDIAFVANDQQIVMMEHQSTLSPNLPLRLLLYLAREYEKIFPSDVRYKNNLLMIPTPEFIVFYNGTAKAAPETELRLSNAYIYRKESYALELKVKMYNINPSAGHPILENCQVLKEYSQFIDRVRAHVDDRHKLELAVKECIKEGILAEYLLRKSSEVVNMLFDEYDYETDIRVKVDEAREAKDREMQEAVEAKERQMQEVVEAKDRRIQEAQEKERQMQEAVEAKDREMQEAVEAKDREMQEMMEAKDRQTLAGHKYSAMSLHQMNIPEEQIAKVLNRSVEEIHAWISEETDS